MKRNNCSSWPMKGWISLFLISILLLNPTLNTRGQMAISSNGSLPNPNAMLDVISTNKGVLIPRISNTTMWFMPSIAGMLVYVNDFDQGFWYNDGVGWYKLLKTGDQKWSGSPDIYYSGGKVGIGTSSPSSSLDIESANPSADGMDINNTGGGDPQVKYQVGGVSKFTVGVDNSDNDNFKIGTSSVSTSVKMTIKPTGEVGIGTESPSATLHVNGTVKALGPWQPNKTEGVDYLALTDGFVVAGLVINSGSGDANGGLKGFTDNNSTPTICRGLACVRKYGTGTVNGQDSFTMPVRKGDSWRVDYTYIEGSIGYSIEWIPFGTNNP